MDWFFIPLTFDEIESIFDITVPGRGEMTVRFLKINGKYGWVIDGNVIFQDYYQDFYGNYGFFVFEGQYVMGFKSQT